jgi:hypothetical protein
VAAAVGYPGVATAAVVTAAAAAGALALAPHAHGEALGRGGVPRIRDVPQGETFVVADEEDAEGSVTRREEGLRGNVVSARGFVRVKLRGRGRNFPSPKRLGVNIRSCWRWFILHLSKKQGLGGCLGNSWRCSKRCFDGSTSNWFRNSPTGKQDPRK